MSLRVESYLDYNGSSPLFEETKEAMKETFELCGNSSSVHTWGRRSRQILEESRRSLANSLGALSEELIFTSGGTEANALALKGVGGSVKHIFVSASDHDAVLKNAPHATLIPVNDKGQVVPETLAHILDRAPCPFLCSIIWGHNETGVLNDIPTLARLVHERGGIFHTDAVQVVGKEKISFEESGVDLMSLSAHKAGGPCGVGALLIKGHILFEPLWMGGGQERGLRSGTSNVALIRGWAVAQNVIHQKQNFYKKLWIEWREKIEEKIQKNSPKSLIIGHGAERLAQTLCVTMPSVKTEVQLMHFDLENIFVSSGAACSSGKVSISPKLLAMGYPPHIAETAIRISWGWKTQQWELERFVDVWRLLWERQKEKEVA